MLNLDTAKVPSKTELASFLARARNIIKIHGYRGQVGVSWGSFDSVGCSMMPKHSKPRIMLNPILLQFQENMQDIFDGTVIHETEHLISSTYMSELPACIPKKYDENKHLFKWALNAIDDLRIEVIAAERSPGFSYKIRLLNDAVCLEPEDKEKMSVRSWIFLITNFVLVRPQAITEEMITFEREGMYPYKFVSGVKDKLLSGDWKLFECTEALTDYILRFQNPPSDRELKEIKDKYEEVTGDNPEDVDPKTPLTFEELIENHAEAEKEQRAARIQEEKAQHGESDGKVPEMPEGYVGTILSDALEGSAEIEAELEEGNALADHEFKPDGQFDVKWVSTKDSTGGERKIYTQLPNIEGRDAYAKELRASMHKYVARMKNIFSMRLADQHMRRTDLHEGFLDNTMLAHAKATDRIFYEPYTIKARGLTVGFLLDESGSMGRAPGSRRATAALEMGYVFLHALKDLPHTNLYMWSHTSGGEYDDDCLITRIWDKGTKKPDNILGFTNSSPAQNYDHAAIGYCGEQISAEPTPIKLFFVLSDGQPAGHGYGGTSAREAVHKTVTDLERRGIYTCQLAIDAADPEGMFKHYIKFESLNQLLPVLSKKMTRIIRGAGTERS